MMSKRLTDSELTALATVIGYLDAVNDGEEEPGRPGKQIQEAVEVLRRTGRREHLCNGLTFSIKATLILMIMFMFVCFPEAIELAVRKHC